MALRRGLPPPQPRDPQPNRPPALGKCKWGGAIKDG